MIKVGDYVRFKKRFSDRYWYNEETYIVMEKFSNHIDIDVVVLDRKYYVSEIGDSMKVMEIYIELDEKFIRSQKIKKIFDV